jgi:FkbM family methyltransferase
MIANLYALLYRTYSILKKSAAEGALRRWPSAGRRLDQLKRRVETRFLPKAQVWVRVQAGLSQGMWMHLRLPGEALIWRGKHEPEVQNAILAKVRPGAVVYDIGANVGTMALGAALLVGDLGLVVAFDGDPENVARLREHSARNRLENRLRVVHTAVWSRTAIDGIGFRRGAPARSQGGVEADGNRPVLGRGEVISVPAVTLDDFVDAGEPPPQLLKIDVEGGEYEVLLGGRQLFAKQRPVVIAEVHHQQAAEQIISWLSEYQYCAQWNIPKEKFPRHLFAWPAETDGEAWMALRRDKRKIWRWSSESLMGADLGLSDKGTMKVATQALEWAPERKVKHLRTQVTHFVSQWWNSAEGR